MFIFDLAQLVYDLDKPCSFYLLLFTSARAECVAPEKNIPVAGLLGLPSCTAGGCCFATAMQIFSSLRAGDFGQVVLAAEPS